MGQSGGELSNLLRWHWTPISCSNATLSVSRADATPSEDKVRNVGFRGSIELVREALPPQISEGTHQFGQEVRGHARAWNILREDSIWAIKVVRVIICLHSQGDCLTYQVSPARRCDLASAPVKRLVFSRAGPGLG